MRLLGQFDSFKLFIFAFLPNDFTSTKNTKTLNKRTKIKNALKKYLREK